MQRAAGFGFILIGVLHMAVLGRDAWPQLPAILSGILWTSDHALLPVTARDPTLLLAEHAFWSTLGSAGVPLIVLGSLIVWIDRRGLHVPVAVAAALIGWSLIGVAMMQPSGLPLILFVSVLLLLTGLRARRRQNARRVRSSVPVGDA